MITGPMITSNIALTMAFFFYQIETNYNRPTIMYEKSNETLSNSENNGEKWTRYKRIMSKISSMLKLLLQAIAIISNVAM